MSIVVRRWPSFGLQVAIGLGAGIVLGLLAREGGTPGTPSSLGVGLQTVGSIFVQLLKLMLPLLVFGTIVASVAALCELTDAARLAWRTLASFAITSRIAVAIGIGLGGLIEPGLRSTVSAAAAAPPPPPPSAAGSTSSRD